VSRAALAAGLLLLAGAAAAEPTPEARGLEIALAADARGAGFADYAAVGEMILKDKGGAQSRRRFRLQVLEADGDADGDRSLLVFDWPADIKDTALLTVAHKEGDDDQWLYLPALKRVKRISASGRSGSFVGSELAYEDMVGEEVERYRHRWLRDEPCPGGLDLLCHVNERVPVEVGSGYSRQVAWLDTEELRVVKVDYYDRKGDLLKTMIVEGYRRYLERFWRAERMVMTNHQTGKSTEMLWSDYRFQVGMSAEDFSPRALERAR
jgi:outer membrane lipoprotein-sorting protein